MRRFRTASVLVLGLVVAPLADCTCQRAENVEAKARLTKPAPPDTTVAAALEAIAVDELADPARLGRVCRMDGAELAARLGSFQFNATGDLAFGRASGGVRSSEKTRVRQAQSGDFDIEVISGDGSEMRLAYVNEIFFLRNNNGQWRVSRDPSGEREKYRTDAMGVWRSFYDLVQHALQVQRTGATTFAGRPAVAYNIKLPDQSREAWEAGKTVTDGPPAPIADPTTDGGVVIPAEDPKEKRARLQGRLAKWQSRAKPAGGSGKLIVDEKTGVLLSVEFEGKMVVGDGPDPATLEVKFKQQITDIGRVQDVAAPKDAIEEIVRKKTPVDLRGMLEDEGIVEPLLDAGPGGGRKKKKPTHAPVAGPPDDE